MFLVFNKQKIYSYLVALSTVVVLLSMAKIYTNKSSEIVDTFSAAKTIPESTSNQNEPNNCITLKDDWTDNDVYQILQIMKKYNINMKFYVTKEWKVNHNASTNQISNYGHEILEYEQNSDE